VANKAVVVAGGWVVGMLVADTAKQSAVKVPGELTRSFRRTTDQVLLSFHTWGKRAYQSTFCVP